MVFSTIAVGRGEIEQTAEQKPGRDEQRAGRHCLIDGRWTSARKTRGSQQRQKRRGGKTVGEGKKKKKNK